MERDGGLACTRTALNDDDAGQRRSDDAVLLGLDGSHDVRHLAGSPGVEGCQQRPLALERVSIREHGGVEHIVFNGNDVPPRQNEVAPAPDAHPLEGGRLVEGACLRCPPVDHELLQVLGGKTDPADVALLSAVQVQAPEHQPVIHRVQLREPVLIHGRERVAFGPVLVRPG